MGDGIWKRLDPLHAVIFAAVLAAMVGVGVRVAAQSAPAARPAVATAQAAPPARFVACQGCHGAGGAGGDRAPALVNSAKLRALSQDQIKAIIKTGTPGGMPPFPLPEAELDQIAGWIKSQNQAAAQTTASPEQIAAGEAFFFGDGECASCHMVSGRGTVKGPDLSNLATRASGEEIQRWLDNPDSQRGLKKTASCPGWAFCPDLQWGVVNVKMKDGGVLRGFSRNIGEHDLQLQTFDGRLHLLTDKQFASIEREPKSYMPPLKATPEQRRDLLAYLSTLRGTKLGPLAHTPAPLPAAEIERIARPRVGEWPTYDGAPRGNRFSPLDQINTGNVTRLQARWTFTPGGTGLQNTPVVVDGVMYVTGAQQVCALDARSGRYIWCAARNSGETGAAQEAPRPGRAPAVLGPAAGERPFGGATSGTGPNRGVAVQGDLVYFVSDDCYLVALHRLTGAVVWRVRMTDPAFPGGYYNTAAPLVVGDLIVAGVAGGDSPLRGFLIAFKAQTGEMAWRLWTIPLPGEPLSETWGGTALPTGGGATWTTGSYDADANVLYWAVGNPYPDTDGDQRKGSNLYTNTVLALEPETGKVKWHFQFTPHDLHDWDANTPLVLADLDYKGKPRKLLLQANRNGFFYVLDRTTGEFLSGTPFVKKLTWASGIGPDGAPILLPGNEPTVEGTLTCPSVRGGTNWYATSFNPLSKLFYVMAAEDCGIYRKIGSIYAGKPNPDDPGQRFLRALDPQTGKVVWEKQLVGSQEANYGGVLSTAGGVVFHGETGGAFAAVDAVTGKTLWTFNTNEAWRATAMTYLVDGKQYVAVAAGTNIVAFSLAD
jgi:PQQ-dependent dehydrogenase (methanol/ethanol family)